MLHGHGGCIGSFAPVANFLAASYKVVSIDFPGYGKSEEPPVPWSIREYAELTNKIIKQLEIAPCSLIAHSFGGRVAILLAAQYPQNVDKLVLCDSAGLIPKRSASYYVKIYSYKLAKKISKNAFFNSLFGIEKRMKNAGSSDYRQLSPMMRATFVRVVNQNLRGHLKHIKAPTLLIWGSEDQDTPLYFAKIMEKEIPDAGLVVFEGAGHFSYLDDLQRFNAILSVFMGGN